jgi:RecB family endonuclease NucS
MPVELDIWRIDGPAQRLRPGSMDTEERLEALLHGGLGLLDDELLLLGRQVQTDFGKKLDLLGLDVDGNLVVIELKKGRSPRDAVAQLLDYGSWVRQLTRERISLIFGESDGRSLSRASV